MKLLIKEANPPYTPRLEGRRILYSAIDHLRRGSL